MPRSYRIRAEQDGVCVYFSCGGWHSDNFKTPYIDGENLNNHNRTLRAALDVLRIEHGFSDLDIENTR